MFCLPCFQSVESECAFLCQKFDSKSVLCKYRWFWVILAVILTISSFDTIAFIQWFLLWFQSAVGKPRFPVFLQTKSLFDHYTYFTFHINIYWIFSKIFLTGTDFQKNDWWKLRFLEGGLTKRQAQNNISMFSSHSFSQLEF